MVVGVATVVVSSAKLLKITVSPDKLEIAYPARGQFTATGYYDDNTHYDLSQMAAWEFDTDPATLELAQGVVTPRAIVSAKVTASFENVTGSADLVVGVGTPLSLQGGDDTTLPRQVTAQLAANASYADGSTVEVTRFVSWHTDDPNIAVIDVATTVPLLTGVHEGTTKFYATLGNLKSPSNTVTVSSAVLLTLEFDNTRLTVALGDNVWARAIGFYDDGNQYDLTEQATWKTGNPAIATVLDTPGKKGTITPVSLGTTTLTATFGSLSVTTTITVFAP
jgi:hypothetical protein